MNSLVVNIFIVVLHISTLVNLTAADDLGPSSCWYLGEFDPANKSCHIDPLNIEDLPKECTAFVFDGISFNDSGTTHIDIETITSLQNVNKNLHLLYSYNGLHKWYNAIKSDDAKFDLKLVKSKLNGVTIAGLIFKGIDDSYGCPHGLCLPDDFNSNLNKFMLFAKNIMCNIKFGLYINAKCVIYYGNNTSKPWYDFSMLDKVVDYYVIGFENFNECSDTFLNGGITPVFSEDPNINSLTSFYYFLLNTNISTSKLYLEYSINPTVKLIDEPVFMKCERSYNEYCTHVKYKNRWCADNGESFYNKGVFAKSISKGFIAKYIDLVDRDLKCDCCGDKFVTFQMVLQGYREKKKLTFITCNIADGL